MKSKILACLAMGVMAVPAQAAIVITMTEVGGNVLVSGSGSVNLGGLFFVGGGNGQGFVRPSDSLVIVGPPTNAPVTAYSGAAGPFTLGSSTLLVDAESGTGSVFGVLGNDSPALNSIYVPKDYVSKTELSGTSTYTGKTFASLGLTTGTYVWTWGSGADADSFTLKIGDTTTAPPVPLPAAAWLLLSGLAGLGVVGRRKRTGAPA